MKTSDAIKYGSIAVGAVSATILALNYFNEKTHKKLQAELLALQLEEYREKKANGFRNFTAPIDITASLPTKSSATPEWCLFYETMKKRYGKQTAELLFVKAWEARKGNNVNAVEVKNCTGLPIDTSWREQTLAKFNKLADTGFNTFESNFKFIGNTPKVLFWGGIAVGTLILGVWAYKIIKFQPDQKGISEGAAFGAVKALKGGL